ncbi:MAG: 5'-methylthioadenosine/adenosylhomocysteine nucleosidase [Dongiaceae bacterium]
MSSSVHPLGIIAALPEEIADLGDALVVDETAIRGELAFRRGRLDGAPVMVVEGGIGKVNSAWVTGLLLDRFDCRGVLFTGVAGGLDPTLKIGDVVVADRLIQHDYGAVADQRFRRFRPGLPPFGEPRHQLAYEMAPELRGILAEALPKVELPLLPATTTGGSARQPLVRFGTILSGDQFINCKATREELFATFAAQAVEMEGAAIAQVAERYNAPCIVVRCLSDLAGADSHIDFATFLSAAAESAARVVRHLVHVL